MNIFFFFLQFLTDFICVPKRWMDGSPVVFQRWDEGQPRFENNDENCAEMTPFKGE